MDGVGLMRPEELAAWVAASCEAQGLEVKVTDAGVLRSVCVLLGTGASGQGPKRKRRRRPLNTSLQPPEGANPVGVKATGSGDAGADDGVIENGSDDGVLAVEVEAGPLSA